MKSTLSILILVALLFASLPAAAQKTPSTTAPFEPSAKSWKFADKTLRKMTLEEKIGQMVHIGINARYANQDSDFFRQIQKDVVESKVGGIILFGAPIYETVHFVNRMQQNARTPLLISIDAESGVGMRFSDAANFPWAMAVAATGKPEYARKIGEVTGREARLLGIQHVFAPVLDVNNDPDNPVINVRSFGEDPKTVGVFGAEFVRGLQSQKAIATAKHFPGHGDTAVDSHRGLPIINVTRDRLESVEFPPFKMAIDAGVGSIMIGHIGMPQIDPTEIRPIKNALRVDAEEGAEIVTEKTTVPATLSKKVQTDILRKEMGFKGMIVTDAMSMSGLTLYVTQEEAAVRAVEAGTDILEKPADTVAMIKGLKDAVASGRISVSRIDDSVRKILAWKHATGLFEKKITDIDAIDKTLSSREVYALVDEIASQAITLVRDGGAIPAPRNRNVVVLGLSNTFDNEATIAPFTRTLRETGIRHQAFVIQENSSAESVARAREAAMKADLVIVGLYGRVRSGAKNSVGVPEAGARLLDELIEGGKDPVGIAFGNPYALRNFPKLKTYLVAFGDMPALQRAAARGVFGMQDITGRLPISIPGLHRIGEGLTITMSGSVK